MELSHLRYFLMLCQELHFTEAANKLGITQPSLSQQIKNLEEEVGLPLFDRIGKKTVKTEAGELLEVHAKKAIYELSEAQNAISDLKKNQKGRIRLAVLPSDLDYHLTQLLIDFHQSYPEVKVEVIPSTHILELVESNQVDIGIGLAEKKQTNLVQTPIIRETYDLYVGHSHPLAEETCVSLERISQEGQVMFPKGFTGRQLIDDWAKKQGIALQVMMETGSVNSLFQLVEGGVGVTIQPKKLIEGINPNQLVSLEIEQAPTRDVTIYYLKGKYLSRAMTTFIDQLLHLF